MKINCRNNILIIFLKKEQIKNIDFKDIDSLEDYFMNLFVRLKKIIDIDMFGFYLLNIYLDKYYGAVIEIKKGDSEYYYFDNQIDMRINVIDTDFLYERDSYDIDRSKYDVYLYKKKLYYKIKHDLNITEIMNLFENSNIIYDTENIILSSKKI